MNCLIHNSIMLLTGLPLIPVRYITSIVPLSLALLGIGVIAFLVYMLLNIYAKSRKKERELELRFKILVESAKDIIYTTNANGNFDYVNDATLLQTGYSKEELMGRNFKTLVREDYKHSISAYYKKQIREKSSESYNEFPFISKSGKTIWVGQSVLFKYDEQGKYSGAEIICRDVSERVLAEETLKQHNLDLKVINEVKELILTSDEPSSLYIKMLIALGNNSDKSDFFSINIFDRSKDMIHIYSLTSKDKRVSSLVHEIKPETINSLKQFTNHNYNFEKDVKAKEIYQQLHQPCEKYKSAVIQTINGGEKLYGFIGFFSEKSNVYPESHLILVNDICTALGSFFVQYDQRRIIGEYSKQLELLNKSKATLMNCLSLQEVYNKLIDIFYQELENIYRVSIIIHDTDKKIGNMIYRDVISPEIYSKLINTKDIPFIHKHLQNEVFDIPDFENDISLTAVSRLWYESDVMSVYSMPVFLNKKLYASVNLVSRKKNNFSEQQKLLIKEIVESAEPVIEQIIFKEIISEKNKDISDNINYARRIQNALMPSEEMLQSLIAESFLVFQQRDSLGGDFYWFEKIGDHIFLTVGDCTGHGVSGSLLTILATDYIKQAVETKKMTDPGIILEHVRDSLHSTLNKYSNEDEIIDGLDISFGVYNQKTKTFLYASAMHNFYLVRNNELIEYKGNKKTIGGTNSNESGYFFTTHLFQLKKNDMIYFSTDGYYDQLQHTNEKRFGRNRFKQLLLLISDKKVCEQKEILLEQHLKWKGNLPQTDDICLLGFKVV